MQCLFPPPSSAADNSPAEREPPAQEPILWRVWDDLSSLFQAHQEHYAVAKTWLLSSIAKLSPSARFREDAFAPCLDGKSEGARKVRAQLLRLWLEERPSDAASLVFEKKPELYTRFFESKQRVLLWFSHFSMDGLGSFKYGARALARYALTHRDEAWQHLVWEGKHPQAPVTVATKTYYFCELDIVASVRNILRHCPGFCSSDEFRDSLSGGEIISLDTEHWEQVFDREMSDGSSLGVRTVRVLERWVGEQCPWATVCHRTLHGMSEEQLLKFIETVSVNAKRSQATKGQDRDVKRTTEPLSALSHTEGVCLWRGVTWASLPQLVITHAMASRRRDLLRMLTHDDSCEAPVTRMCAAAAQLHPPHPGMRSAVNKRLSELADSLRDPCTSVSTCQLLGLHAWTLTLSLHTYALCSTPTPTLTTPRTTAHESEATHTDTWHATLLYATVQAIGGRCEPLGSALRGRGHETAHTHAGVGTSSHYELLSDSSNSDDSDLNSSSDSSSDYEGSTSQSDSQSASTSESGSESEGQADKSDKSGKGGKGRSGKGSGRSKRVRKGEKHRRRSKGKKGKRKTRKKTQKAKKRRRRSSSGNKHADDDTHGALSHKPSASHTLVTHWGPVPTDTDTDPHTLTHAELARRVTCLTELQLDSALPVGLLAGAQGPGGGTQQGGQRGAGVSGCVGSVRLPGSASELCDVLASVSMHALLGRARISS